jgi:hypothetical protein
MQTRSQTKSKREYDRLTVYEVDIDFDEASRLWKYNKKSVGNGSYEYICCILNRSGKKCGKKVFLDTQYCKSHNNLA